MRPLAEGTRGPSNGLELSCPAEAGRPPLLYAGTAGDSSISESAARRVSFSELLGRTSKRGLLLLRQSCMRSDHKRNQSGYQHPAHE